MAEFSEKKLVMKNLKSVGSGMSIMTNKIQREAILSAKVRIIDVGYSLKGKESCSHEILGAAAPGVTKLME